MVQLVCLTTLSHTRLKFLTHTVKNSGFRQESAFPAKCFCFQLSNCGPVKKSQMSILSQKSQCRAFIPVLLRRKRCSEAVESKSRRGSLIQRHCQRENRGSPLGNEAWPWGMFPQRTKIPIPALPQMAKSSEELCSVFFVPHTICSARCPCS